MAADRRRSADEYVITLRSILHGGGVDPCCVREVMIGSVVPRLTHTLCAAAEGLSPCCGEGSLTGEEALSVTVVGSGVRTGVSLLVDEPAQLGADIVCNAAAAVWLYGAPVILVDFGTATVLSAVNAGRALMGVAISPGLNTSLEGLQTAAAQIPYIELKSPGATLGRNTAASTRSGIVYGTACMVDGMIDRILAEAHLPPTVPVVATGGMCNLVRPFCRHTLVEEKDLTLLGLARIAMLTGEREGKRTRKTGAQDRLA
jgi:type III pantothenate kinase